MAYEVTIGIPVYNVEKYIRLTMDSALAQTFPDIEFLVIDDCGTDSSMDIVREYQQRHPRGKDIRIVRQPQNGGLGRARNRIVEEARGKYLYYLDADDAIAANAISLLYNQAVEHDADIVYGSYERVYTQNGKTTDRTAFHYDYRVFTGMDTFACFAYEGNVQTMTWNFLIKIGILRDNHLRVAPVGFGEDYTFTVDLPTYVERAVLLPDVTYYYYVRDVNVVRWNRNVTRQMMDAYIQTIDEKKRRTGLRRKPYYAKRCETLLMYDFSFVGQILKRRDQLIPRYTDREIRDVMWHPMTLWEILRSPASKSKSLAAYVIAHLPSALAVLGIKIFFHTVLKHYR
jgi:glycosyltransferase involved in cell wall biosynthesis